MLTNTDIARFQVASGLHHHADAAAGADRNDITRFQGHHRAEIFHQIEAVKNHMSGGIEGLTALVIDPSFDVQGMGVPHYLIGRDDPGPDRAGRVEGFSKGSGVRAHLPVAHRDIIGHDIPGNHLMGPLLRHVPAAPTDHECQLTFIIELAGDPRSVGRSAGTDDAADLLIEKCRKFRPLLAGFGDMVGIVETHGEIFGGLTGASSVTSASGILRARCFQPVPPSRPAQDSR